jgi:hypothetical protein
MTYNTTEKRLALPEYGRNIQNMVNYCQKIKDRDERNTCANAIIGIMGNMFPQLRDVNDYKHILWDHLAIMADFKLDVDYPFPVIKKAELYKRPPQVRHTVEKIAYRHYGRYLEQLSKKLVTMEDGEEKEKLILMIGNQLKKSYLTWNKDSVENSKILRDLAELSGWKVIRYEDMVPLGDVAPIEIVQQAPVSKRKKKKKNKA